MSEDLELEEEAAGETTPLEYGVWHMPADYPLETIYQKIQNKEIEIPRFQRGYVWSETQASRLVKSFIMGLPVPPVFLFVKPDQRMLVIDGAQRLLTIFYFFEESFGRRPDGPGRAFRLAGINPGSRLYGKQMSTLEGLDSTKLKNTILRAVQIQQTRPGRIRSSMCHVFKRLNARGASLKDQEVRNCVYQGRLNDLLVYLNDNESWREILGAPAPHSGKKDVQLILRYMSLFHDGASYREPLADFMSDFMGRNLDPPDDFIRAERRRFEKTCRIMLGKAGNSPFRPNKFFNQAVFDSVFVAFAKHADRCPDDVSDRVKALHADPRFQRHTAPPAADEESVRARLALAERILFGDAG